MKMFQKLSFITAVLIFIAFTAPLFAQSDSPGDAAGKEAVSETPKKDEKAAAVVNGVKIPKAVVQKELENMIERQAAQGKKTTEEETSRLKKMVLDTLINKELLYQKGVEKGIQVDETEINAQIENLRARFSTDAEYNEYLKKMRLTDESIKERIRQTMTIRKFIGDEFQNKVSVSDEEAKEFFDAHPEIFNQSNQVHAAHILIKVDPDAEEAEKSKAMKKIKDIKKQLDEGADFEKLAKEHSEGPSGPKGGDLGFFGRGQMVKPFENVAFSLEPGGISDVVETRFGYHIIKVLDKKEGKSIDYNQVKQRIIQNLQQQKVEKKVFEYLEELKEAADIKISA